MHTVLLVTVLTLTGQTFSQSFFYPTMEECIKEAKSLSTNNLPITIKTTCSVTEPDSFPLPKLISV